MFKKVLLSLCFIFALNTLFAQDLAYILPQAEPTLDDIQNLVEQGNYPLATQILEQAYQEAQTKQEKEEITFILASIATKDEDYNRAVRLYRQLLNFNPSLTMARFNLAWVYFLKKEYEGARFNMKLALAQEDLPEEMRMQGNWLLYEIRQKKVWNAQIQVGIAPDTNINGVSGKQIECFYYAGLPFCRELESIQSDIGFQGSGLFDYTYKFNDKWSIKNRLSVDAIHYDDERFSFWSLGLASGPRYTAQRGEYWLGASYKEQFNEEHRYSHTAGLFAEASKDLNQKLSLFAKVEVSDIHYIQSVYKVFNAQEYALNARLFFFLNNYTYFVFGAGFSMTDAKLDYNSYFHQGYSLGLGVQLPYGFNIYIEPNISSNYFLKKGTYINDGTLVEKKRREHLQGVYISLSSNLLSVYDLTPRVNFIYNKRTSNIESYDFERTRWEFGISKAF
ncbi:MAG: DUF560 domain-containing protein [Elusimicrobiaceae bacterium]|nr:DUF560 domain-containing protein [Elusimicrobiaceae bacterium]